MTRMRPLPLTVLLAALLAATNIVGAQAAPSDSALPRVAPTNTDMPPPLAVPAGAELTPGVWRYRVLMSRDGQSMELARRTVRVLRAPASPDAWLLIEETDSHGRLMADSVLLARDGLRPLSRDATMGPVRLSLRFDGDSVRGAMTAPGVAALGVSLPNVAGLVASSAMLESFLTLVPLDSGWAATVVQVAPGPAGVALVPLTLRVDGAESVRTFDGDHQAWRLTAIAADTEQLIWVDRGTGRLLRMESAAPQSPDVRYLTVLEQAEPEH